MIMQITDLDGKAYKASLNIGVFLDILLTEGVDFFNPFEKSAEGLSAFEWIQTPKGLRRVLFYACTVEESDKLRFFQKLPLDILKRIYPRLLAALVAFYSGGKKAKSGDTSADCQGVISESTVKKITLDDMFGLITAANAGGFYRRLQLWELQALAVANLKQQAAQQSALLCMMWNVHARKRSQIKEPRDFNAFMLAEKKERLEALRRKYQKNKSLSEFINENQRGNNGQK